MHVIFVHEATRIGNNFPLLFLSCRDKMETSDVTYFAQIMSILNDEILMTDSKQEDNRLLIQPVRFEKNRLNRTS